jgi:hypothetical protein
MSTKLDLLKRDVEMAEKHIVRVAYQTAAARPESELKRACDLLDAALHRLYEEEAAIAA